jgi:tetratricopeptide (TPR) repeat protein
MGVNSGHVWVGSIGSGLRRDYTAEGTTVGIAARLEAAAAPGQILVGGETARRCRDFFTFAALGEQPIRGLPEPVRVFELLGPGAHQGRFAVERARGLTPFVGRERELRQLREMARSREGVHFIEVRGEAGIGKSRLVLEHAARSPIGTAVLETHCREADSQRAYLPWLEILRAWPPELPRSAEVDPLIERLEGRLAQEGSSPPEAGAAILAILSEAVAVGPVLLVLDDAHCLDPSSRSVVRMLAEHPPDGFLTVLATLRDEGERDWGAGGSVERIDLAPLEENDSRELARAILQEIEGDAALCELAALRGGGNPLFVEEMARAFREGPPPVRHAARLELDLLQAPLRIPSTLHGVVAARIDALPESSKLLLEAAAVLGQSFDPDLLPQIEPLSDADPQALLADLVERGLLLRTRSGEVDFCHGVVREVACEQLVRERRRSLHRRIADALTRLPAAGTADGASRIGGHYDRAGDAAAATPHLIRAGRAYADLDAPSEAAAHLRRALELLRSSTRRDHATEVDVAMLLATSLNVLDHSGEAAAVLEAIEADPNAPADRLRVAEASIQGGWARFSDGNDVARGRRLIERGLSLADGIPEAHRTMALGHAYLARILILDGEVEAAAQHSRRVVELATARGDTAGRAVGLCNEAAALCEAGRIGEARDSAREARRLARELENEVLIGTAEVAMAKAHLFAGDPERALEAARRAAVAGEKTGSVGVLYQSTGWSAYAHVLAGDPKTARKEFERLAELNDTWPATWLHRARGRLEVGEFGAAVDLARDCLAREPARMIRARALAVLGLAIGLSNAGSFEEAECYLRESVSQCDSMGLLPHLAEAHHFLAELFHHRGDPKRASDYARRAAEEFESCGMAVHAKLARSKGNR